MSPDIKWRVSMCAYALSALTIVDEAGSLEPRQHIDYTFQAVSGSRYEVVVRTYEGSGQTAPCTVNNMDQNGAEVTCDNHISSAQLTCGENFCNDDPTCDYAHQCDNSCGFDCVSDGISKARLNVLEPGATQDSQAVASDTRETADKDLSFTATTTGTFAVRVAAASGSGPFTLTIMAIGTALERSPRLRLCPEEVCGDGECSCPGPQLPHTVA
jgi:hypothetical protein